MIDTLQRYPACILLAAVLSLSGLSARPTELQRVSQSLNGCDGCIDALSERLEKRKVEMMDLMRSDPRAAWDKRLSLSEYTMIPARLRHLVETPFAKTVSYTVLASPESSASVEEQRSAYAIIQYLDEGEAFVLETYDPQPNLRSKEALSVFGFHLDGLAVIDTRRAVPIALSEIELARNLFNATTITKQAMDPLRGEALNTVPVHYALIGQSIVAFAEAEAINRFNQRMRLLDRAPTPHTPNLEVFLRHNLVNGSPASSERKSEAPDTLLTVSR